MRIIIGLFFAAVIVACSGQRAVGQMRLSFDELEPEIVGNCFIYHLRAMDEYPKVGQLQSKVCSSPKGWSPARHVPFFLHIALNSYYNAERATCGSYGCSSTGKDMRLILVGDPLPRAYVATSDGAPAINLIITTTLVDFIQRSAHMLANDMLEDPKLAPEGYYAWLASLRELGGKSCSLPVKWTNTSLSPRIGEQNVYRVAGTTYQFLFAHEMAHLRTTNNACGYKSNQALTAEMNSQGVELACDKLAFDTLAKADMALPLFTVATFMGMQHYLTLKKPQLMAQFPGGPASFREAFPALGFKERSQELVTAWKGACPIGRPAAMCQMQEVMAVEARKIIDSPPPCECVP